MTSADTVNRAAAEASASKVKLAGTVSELRTRLNPDTLLDDAFETVSTQGQKLVNRTKDTVSAHPLAIGTAVAAIGLALLARNTLANATVDLGDPATDYTDYDDEFEPSASQYSDAKPLAARAQDSITGNPLLSVVLGIAAGAVLGLITQKK